MSLLMDISFGCRCSHHIEATVYVPAPDFMAEKSRDSTSEHWEEIECEKCGDMYEAYITNSFSYAECSIDNGEIDVNYSVPYYPDLGEDDLDWFIESSKQFSVFERQIENVKGLLEAEVSEEQAFSLHVMLHGHVVAAVEAYLASTFIHKVTNNSDLIQKLVETDPTFSQQKFTLKEIFQKQNQLKQTVAKYLKDLIFHDLKKVKPMYKEVLSVDFGEIKWLFQAVSTRHHCVHRAGYDKDGNPLVIGAESIRELVDKSWSFIVFIEEKLKTLEQQSDLDLDFDIPF
ncbi:hypothetical protein [Vibrio parahaemolyticus]|uniref:hypothetical protein n=2 Tax=Vibrio parahaemolyticus TaxID=670 RepID=UPI002362C9EA|nr:hypothetical protein [Vibrio parahaemolyticus]